MINALRSAKDARYPVMAGAGSVLIVLAGGSWFFGVNLGWGPPGIGVANTADEWFRSLLMWRRWARPDRVPDARTTRRKLQRQAAASSA